MALKIVTGGTTGAADGTLVSSGNPLVIAALNTAIDAHIRCDDGYWSADQSFDVPAELEVSFDGGSTWKGNADEPITAPELYAVNVPIKVRQTTAAASTSGSFTTDGTYTAISALGNVGSFAAASGSASGQVALSWAAVTNRTSYRIDRATDSGFTAGVALDISPGHTSTSFTDTGRTPGTTYYYRIKAVGSGRYSDSASYATANAAAAQTVDAAILALSPLTYFKTTETSGTTLTDSGSLANNATLSGTPTLAQTGPKGLSDAIYLDSGDRILAPNSSSLRFTGTGAFTVMAWVNLDGVTGAVRNFISQDKNDVGYAGWQVSFDTDGTIICYRLNSGNTPTYQGKSSTAVVAATGWHLYTVTYDGSNWKFYRDGAQIGSDVASTYTVSATSTQQFKVGNFSSDIGNSPLLGKVCKPAVFGSALSLAQIQTVANAV